MAVARAGVPNSDRGCEFEASPCVWGSCAVGLWLSSLATRECLQAGVPHASCIGCDHFYDPSVVLLIPTHTPTPGELCPGRRPPPQPPGRWSQWAQPGVSKRGRGDCWVLQGETQGHRWSQQQCDSSNHATRLPKCLRVCAWPLLWAPWGTVYGPPHLQTGPGSCTHNLLCQGRFLLSAEVQLPRVPGGAQLVTVTLAWAWEESTRTAVRLDTFGPDPCMLAPSRMPGHPQRGCGPSAFGLLK